MNIFAIGDLHLSFSSNKPMAIFGSQWEEHIKKLELGWRSKVTEEDIVLIPGDISWALRYEEAKVDLEWLNELPGTKICIRGNHDYWWDRPGKLNRAYENIIFLQSVAYKVGEVAICGTRGWECPSVEAPVIDQEQERMLQRELMRLELSLKDAMKQEAQEIWVMLHYPPTFLGEKVSSFTQLMSRYPVTKVIYGHLHDRLSWEKAIKGPVEGIYYELVASDYLNFKPKWLTCLEEEMN